MLNALLACVLSKDVESDRLQHPLKQESEDVAETETDPLLGGDGRAAINGDEAIGKRALLPRINK